ncbi:ribose ABC transporter [Rhizobium sp. Root149]|uniref:L-fucose mutarotase n=2 Tax=Rhizobium TaxID=379 RepID=A0A7W6LJT3_9HYPH|nr:MULTISPECIES: RbsD/FucU domain-containing protein [Rhizobium]KQZ47997.1 ribose ABC transporter [Rhizobium sp. Root149]MBB4145536.1 L-fucose mutarotase [Rhizobium rhizoryzae]MCJ8507347.1 ribose ABC transporter [Rhizobium lemnae]
MLINIDPLLSPDLLHILRAMGHGDEIAIVDANFPGTTNAQRLVRLDGISVTRATEAVLSVMPLDDFVEVPAVTMEVVGNPDEVPPAVQELRAIVGDRGQCGTLERHAFYARAKQCFAIIQTGETRLYGNIVLKKGVVRS